MNELYIQGRIQDFSKVGAGAKRPKNFFRTRVRNRTAPTFSHHFAPTPLFAFLLFWTNFKNFFFAPGCETALHPSFFAPTPGR